MRAGESNGFQWRGSFGSLRWLLLGTLGVSQACGGRTDTTTQPGDPELDSSAGQGGAGATTHPTAAPALRALRERPEAAVR
ncbi:MAG: hypothetical protein RL685_4888 [Pseudomonadota bacterium]|jgi:hypothetical protein